MVDEACPLGNNKFTISNYILVLDECISEL